LQQLADGYQHSLERNIKNLIEGAESLMITSSTKVIAVIALVAALLGATIGGALVRSSRSSQADTTATTGTTNTPSQALTNDGTQTSTETTTTPTEQAKLDTSGTTAEEAAYRDGFEEGFRTARDKTSDAASTSRRSATRTRVVYRNGRTRYVTSNGSRQAYYDYNNAPAPYRGRSFWQKHRDKLTVAMGAGGGALIGGLIGGRRGAGIGALAGGGGSALWTYKLRNRTRRY
jgi:hypothetical protein